MHSILHAFTDFIYEMSPESKEALVSITMQFLILAIITGTFTFGGSTIRGKRRRAKMLSYWKRQLDSEHFDLP